MNAMRQAWAIRRLLFVGALLATSPSAWAGPSPKAAQAAVDALYACFRDATRTVTQNEATVPFGPGSESFFFEQLGSATQSLGAMPDVAWCTTWFVEPYVRAHTALHSPQSQSMAHAPNPSLSTGTHLGAESRLLHLAARMGGVSHVSAHADMMRHALGAPAVARQLARLRVDMGARGLLIHAAQMPDLYLFDEALWHARSRVCPDSAGQKVPCDDQPAFVARVVQAIQRGQGAFIAGDMPQAMVLWGAAAHAVQDLSFHRGMTLAEQSGLTYVAHSNPDHPHGSQAERVVQHATQATAAMMARALAALPHAAQAGHVDVADDHAALAALVMRTLPEAHPVTYTTMGQYYALSFAFGDPADGACRSVLAKANQGRWSAPDTLAAILAGL